MINIGQLLSYLVGFDPTKPGDNDIVSQFPANERDQRAAVASGFGLEHDDAGAGRHKFPTGDTSARDALTGINEGTLFVNTSAGAGNYFVEIFASATSVWETTGRFTSADRVLLDAQASTIATSSEMAAGAVSANRLMSPYLVGVLVSAKVSAAVQADQETGTNLSPYVSPGTQHYHQSAAKAWAKVLGSGDAVTVSYNMTSVTDNSTGDITFNIATDFSSENYAISVQLEDLIVDRTSPLVTVVAAGTVRIKTFDESGNQQDPQNYYIACFGDQ